MPGITQQSQSDVRTFYGAVQAVRLITESPLTLSGLPTVQGVALAEGNRVFVNAQADPIANGVYIASASAWARSVDCEVGDEVGGVLFLVESGTHANEIWRVSGLSNSTIVGTNSIQAEPFQKGIPSGYFTPAAFVWNVNGSLQSGNRLDGIRGAGQAGAIVGVVVALENRGNSGDTIIDINKHSVASPPMDLGETQYGVSGSTVYTTQANRPKLAGDTALKTDNGIQRCLLPDILSFSGGDFFTVDIDEAVTSSKDLTVILFVRYD